MSYTHAAASDVESVIDADYGGMWFLRDALATEELGVTILELESGARGKEHDHEHDGQEEVYRRFEATASGLDPEGKADSIIMIDTV